MWGCFVLLIFRFPLGHVILMAFRIRIYPPSVPKSSSRVAACSGSSVSLVNLLLTSSNKITFQEFIILEALLNQPRVRLACFGRPSPTQPHNIGGKKQ